MYKKSNFPIIIEMQIRNDQGVWAQLFYFIVNDNESLYRKMQNMKSLYKTDREYRIFFTLNSSFNAWKQKKTV